MNEQSKQNWDVVKFKVSHKSLEVFNFKYNFEIIKNVKETDILNVYIFPDEMD